MLAVHYLLPFVLLALLGAHMLVLHAQGSGGPSALTGGAQDAEPFLQYYYKDYATAIIPGGLRGTPTALSCPYILQEMCARMDALMASTLIHRV